MTVKPIYLFSIASHPDTIHINPLDIKILHPDINFAKYDYLIITSKQATKALKEYKLQEYKAKKALCISKASAQSYKAQGGNILEVGAGYGDSLYEKIRRYPKTTKWLYLRAKIIASNFVELAQNDGYNIEEKIVYESQCSADIHKIHIKNESILIFSSPSSIECFLQTNTFTKTHIVIVIGQTTAKCLPKEVQCIVSQTQTILNCVQIAQNL